MTRTPAPLEAPVAAGTRGSTTLARAVAAAAVLQVLAPVVTTVGPGAAPGAGSGPQLLITPVGWAFSIWGVIYALALAQAGAVLVRGAATVPRRLQVGQLVLYAGGTVWIVMAALDSSLATAAALAVMLLGAVVALLAAARGRIDGPRWLRLLTLASVGLYAGWVSAAFFLNVSTALVDLGAVEADAVGWQLVVLGVALATLVGLLVGARGTLGYALAGTWAFTGIAVTGSRDGTTAVTVLAVVAGVVLLAAAAALRTRAHPST